MKLTMVCIYPDYMGQKYLMSGYVLKAYLNKIFKAGSELDVEIINISNTVPIPEICTKIYETKPDFVGYSCYIWNMNVILEACKELKNKMNAITIFGGAEMSAKTAMKHTTKGDADYCIVGEGERKLAGLIDYLMYKGEGEVKSIPNGTGYMENNEFMYIEDLDNLDDLDEIPSPYLTGIVDDSIYESKMLFWETQRGCKNRCKYCVYNRNFNKITYYSVERVIAELDFFIKEKNIYSIWIIDAVISSDIKRSKEIFRHLVELKESGHRIPTLFTEFSYNSVDEEFIMLLSKLKTRSAIKNSIDLRPADRPQHYNEMALGYNAVNNIGIQSFTNDVLKAVSRAPVDRLKFEQFMELCKRYNVLLKIDLIFGLPFETIQSYFDGLDYMLGFLKDTDHILNIHRLQILPGSALEDYCETYGIKYLNEDSRVVISTPDMTQNEIDYTSLLSGILFRVVNSPLRPNMFEAIERSGNRIMPFIEDLYKAIKADSLFKNTRIANENAIDDVYFNVDLFKDLPSKWLIEYFKSYTLYTL